MQVEVRDDRMARTHGSTDMAPLQTVLARTLAIGLVLVAAWTLATAALEAIDEAASQAQAEIDAGAPEASGTAFNPKELSVDKAVPWS